MEKSGKFLMILLRKNFCQKIGFFDISLKPREVLTLNFHVKVTLAKSSLRMQIW